MILTWALMDIFHLDVHHPSVLLSPTSCELGYKNFGLLIVLPHCLFMLLILSSNSSHGHTVSVPFLNLKSAYNSCVPPLIKHVVYYGFNLPLRLPLSALYGSSILRTLQSSSHLMQFFGNADTPVLSHEYQTVNPLQLMLNRHRDGYTTGER